MLPTLLAGIIVLALTAYLLLGGADFGGGVWDLLARGPRCASQRALIAHAIGPVWEANHVWLILAIVLLFTCFPPAFAALMTVLHIPITLMLIGIVMRGSAFAFRSYGGQRPGGQGHDGQGHDGQGHNGEGHNGEGHNGEGHGGQGQPSTASESDSESEERHWGRLFGSASILTPTLLGVCIGAVASDRVATAAADASLAAGCRTTLPDPTLCRDVLARTGFAALFVRPWLTPFAFGVGLFALALMAFLAAVYLTVEAPDEMLREDFRRRALAAAGVVFVLAAAVLALAHVSAPRMRQGLIGSPWALTLHLTTAAAALTAIAALWTRHWQLARLAAAAQVSFILWGWAFAQFPYLVPPRLTIAAAAAPDGTLRPILWALAAGSLILLPSLAYLFRVFKGAALPPLAPTPSVRPPSLPSKGEE